jgi:hypothetical protein
MRGNGGVSESFFRFKSGLCKSVEDEGRFLNLLIAFLC